MQVRVQVLNSALQLLHDEVKTFTPKTNNSVASYHARITAQMQNKYAEWFRIHITECKDSA